MSHEFKVSNGVRQGAVSSPLLFSVYIDELFAQLQKSGIGCRLYGLYFGVVGYADDLLLLSASRSGLQSMVNLCAQFMKAKGLKFSTNEVPEKSKTKCIIFSKKEKERNRVLPISLNGNELPWVAEVKHLGNTLESDNSMRRDIQIKRSKLIGKINSLSQELHFAQPKVFMKLLNIYCVSFHGSCLWNLFSAECDKIYKTWNVAIRQAWKVPYNTHRYLIEEISMLPHPKDMLASRLVSFRDSLLVSPKFSVRLLANLRINDKGTTLGQNLDKIRKELCDVSLSSANVKKHMRYFKLPDVEEWRVGPLRELMEEDLEIPGFSKQELDDMKNYLATA